jgi:hypothetical protein
MPPLPDQCRLLHGPYAAAALRVGDRTDCLMRGTVVITSWTDARISWPRCRRPVGKSHPSLLLDHELARAVRTEAAAAVHWHWGVREPRRHQTLAEIAGRDSGQQPRHASAYSSRRRGRRRGPAGPHMDRSRTPGRREQAKAQDLARHIPHGYHGPWWTDEELALLGTMPDAEVAARTGRTVTAVRVKRHRARLATRNRV